MGDDETRRYIDEHTWAVLATGRRLGSPQASMVGYLVDDLGRFVMSVKRDTAKWRNAQRQPRAALVIPDGRRNVTVYGTLECVRTDPDRAALTADVFARISGGERPDPSSIGAVLDEQQCRVLRLTPDSVTAHDRLDGTTQ